MPAELSPVLSLEWEKCVAHATGCVYRSSLATPREVISKIAPAEESGSPIMLRRRAAHRLRLRSAYPRRVSLSGAKFVACALANIQRSACILSSGGGPLGSALRGL